MVGHQDMGQHPALVVQRREQLLGVGRVDRGGRLGLRVVDEHAVIVAAGRKLMNLQSGPWTFPTFLSLLSARTVASPRNGIEMEPHGSRQRTLNAKAVRIADASRRHRPQGLLHPPARARGAQACSARASGRAGARSRARASSGSASPRPISPPSGARRPCSGALMPAELGAVPWPEQGQSLSVLVEETELPLDDESADRVLLGAHAGMVGEVARAAARAVARAGAERTAAAHRPQPPGLVGARSTPRRSAMAARSAARS